MKLLLRAVLCLVLFVFIFLLTTFITDKIDRESGYYNQGIEDSNSLRESF